MSPNLRYDSNDLCIHASDRNRLKERKGWKLVGIDGDESGHIVAWTYATKRTFASVGHDMDHNVRIAIVLRFCVGGHVVDANGLMVWLVLLTRFIRERVDRFVGQRLIIDIVAGHIHSVQFHLWAHLHRRSRSHALAHTLSHYFPRDAANHLHMPHVPRLRDIDGVRWRALFIQFSFRPPKCDSFRYGTRALIRIEYDTFTDHSGRSSSR